MFRKGVSGVDFSEPQSIVEHSNTIVGSRRKPGAMYFRDPIPYYGLGHKGGYLSG